MADAPASDAGTRQPAPGRECGTCTLCCKLIAVTALEKPPGTWCPHCVRGKGCGIYETRPAECRTFYCHWMLEKGSYDILQPDGLVSEGMGQMRFPALGPRGYVIWGLTHRILTTFLDLYASTDAA